uniref:Sialidase domain-containing protein n=1 Tax=Paramoeba aestuarina TaxID=180227 RepID=A0A7S4PH87_9EUKA
MLLLLFFFSSISFISPSLLPTGEEVDVFNKGDDGYFCYKIPSLLALQSGKLLAFAEARKQSCSDFAWTDLVYKVSLDGGRNWSSLYTLYSNSSNSEKVVIGNAAPVQLRSGKIVVPFCRNNRDVFVMSSSDEGVTWTQPRNISSTARERSWRWVGTGPPGSLQLSSGRVITPSYHTLPFTPPEDGELSEGHVMISDDDGDTWSLGGNWGLHYSSNECQAAELVSSQGTKEGNKGDHPPFLINSRTLSLSRMQVYSYDGGETFTQPYLDHTLSEPFSGCEMSLFSDANNKSLLYFTGPTQPTPFRFNMTLWKSENEGQDWTDLFVVDKGPSGYSSLNYVPSPENGSSRLALLYEKSETFELVMVPDHLVFVYLLDE